MPVKSEIQEERTKNCDNSTKMNPVKGNHEEGEGINSTEGRSHSSMMKYAPLVVGGAALALSEAWYYVDETVQAVIEMQLFFMGCVFAYWVWFVDGGQTGAGTEGQTGSRLNVKTLNQTEVTGEVKMVKRLVEEICAGDEGNEKQKCVDLSSFKLANYFPVLSNPELSKTIKSLKIHVRNCSTFDSEQSLLQLKGLEELQIGGGTLTRSFVDTIKAFPNLKKLDMSDCEAALHFSNRHETLCGVEDIHAIRKDMAASLQQMKLSVSCHLPIGYVDKTFPKAGVIVIRLHKPLFRGDLIYLKRSKSEVIAWKSKASVVEKIQTDDHQVVDMADAVTLDLVAVKVDDVGKKGDEVYWSGMEPHSEAEVKGN
eukprot:Nk52_evm21s288 gene=Nk52_evmTU21s288